MKYIFADSNRVAQLDRIKEGIEDFRAERAGDIVSFSMHPIYDELLCQLADRFLGHWKDQVALVALGGYGRQEMSPYSDIDLLFLRVEDAPEGIYRGIRDILYLLWDVKIEVGHSVRTIEECRLEAGKDLAVLTSLLDTRLVWGEVQLLRNLAIERERLIRDRDPLELYLKIEAEIHSSQKKFGETIYLLQPNVKDGPGSLRYMHCVAWLTSMIFGTSKLEDYPYLGLCGRKALEEVDEGLRFLSSVRTRLHLMAGRRDDLLTFEAQFSLAKQLGFEDTADRKGVESFMREYYRHTSTLDFFGRRILARVRLFLRPKAARDTIKRLKLDNWHYIGSSGIMRYDLDQMDADPYAILLAFRKIADTGCELDIRLADTIRILLRAMDNRWMDDPQANAMFLDILRTRGSVAKALNAMMKTGFLEKFVSAFERVRFLRQHDAYHQYTVDLHTIGVLRNIDEFSELNGDTPDKLLRTIFAKLDKPEILYIAALFHDIGKGMGPGHEVKGNAIALPFLQRFGLSEEEIDEVSFLIRNHLAMSQLALRKDLHDDAMLGRFAENVMHKRRLDMLMLLTHADLRAVGPTAFNTWKGFLLEELYYRTLDVIESEELGGEDLGDWIQEIKTVVRKLVPDDQKGPELDQFLAGAGSRYLLDFYPGIIVEHFLQIKSYLADRGKESMDWEDIIVKKADNRIPGYSSITLMTRDRSGLFFQIAGTLTANRINILSAWSHSIYPQIALATFHVNDIPEGPLDDPERWEGFRKDIARVMAGEADVHELVLTRRGAGRSPLTPFAMRFPVRVEIDNAASDKATIIEVHADDRPGLLYDITRKLADLELDISLTKITTEANRAADVFYVQDKNGEKIVDFDQLKAIKNSLHDHLTDIEESLMNKGKKVAI